MATEGELQSQGIRAAGQAAKEQIKVRNAPKTITLSNGIVLRVRSMPPLLFSSVTNSIPEPEVPKVYMEDKGRDEPNPNHPDYVKAMEDRTAAIALATMNLMLVACTSIDSIPEDCESPEDDGWLFQARMAGFEFNPNDRNERYLAWLRAYAIATVGDMQKVQTVPLQLAGVSEQEVDEAMDAFRSGEGRDSDSGVPSEGGSENGDNISELSPRLSRRDRRARG